MDADYKCETASEGMDQNKSDFWAGLLKEAGVRSKPHAHQMVGVAFMTNKVCCNPCLRG